VEVERLQREYPVKVRWSPYLLDPSIPPEGKPRKPQTADDTPKSHLELMGEARGLTFRRGRMFTPNSHFALEASEFAYDVGQHSDGFHRALFEANFERFENIGDVDVLLGIASKNDIDGGQLRQALLNGDYRDRVDEQIAWARSVGVTGVPTFIFDYKYAIVGAQEYEAFERVMGTLGYGDDSDRSLAGSPGTAEGEDAAAARAAQPPAPPTADSPAASPPDDPDWAI
jgi:predicted DsbA family dithiol-disulfide isomerase